MALCGHDICTGQCKSHHILAVSPAVSCSPDGLQVVGRVRGAAATPMTTAAAMLAAAEAAGGGSAPAGADSSPTAAAAALLASPRHGLHTPRARVSDQQVELAVVGPGDIIGRSRTIALQTRCHA